MVYLDRIFKKPDSFILVLLTIFSNIIKAEKAPTSLSKKRISIPATLGTEHKDMKYISKSMHNQKSEDLPTAVSTQLGNSQHSNPS